MSGIKKSTLKLPRLRTKDELLKVSARTHIHIHAGHTGLLTNWVHSVLGQAPCQGATSSSIEMVCSFSALCDHHSYVCLGWRLLN